MQAEDITQEVQEKTADVITTEQDAILIEQAKNDEGALAMLLAEVQTSLENKEEIVTIAARKLDAAQERITVESPPLNLDDSREATLYRYMLENARSRISNELKQECDEERVTTLEDTLDMTTLGERADELAKIAESKGELREQSLVKGWMLHEEKCHDDFKTLLFTAIPLGNAGSLIQQYYNAIECLMSAARDPLSENENNVDYVNTECAQVLFVNAFIFSILGNNECILHPLPATKGSFTAIAEKKYMQYKVKYDDKAAVDPLNTTNNDEPRYFNITHEINISPGTISELNVLTHKKLFELQDNDIPPQLLAASTPIIGDIDAFNISQM